MSKKNTYLWSPDQEKAFEKIKRKLSKPTVLAIYDPTSDTKISADASSFGLGAVLLQKHELDWKPIAYASRAMTETERRDFDFNMALS